MATAPEMNPDITKEAVENGSETSKFENSNARLQGRRYWLTMTGLYLGLFLVTLEMTILSTAVVAIANDLQDFNHVTWIVNAYFLTWAGFLILWAQFSHTAGRKPSLVAAVVLFTVFSAGCAAAQTALQLIILRAFQGASAAGVFSLPTVIVSEAVSPKSLPKYVAFMSLSTVIAFAVGPVVGGAISTNTTWRWVFIVNVPLGALALVADAFGLPSDFPHHHKADSDKPKRSIGSLRQLDIIGGVLFLAASIMFVTGLQEAGASLPWNSSVTICLIVASAILWSCFMMWERYLDRGGPQVIPVMTWKFTRRRIMAMFASSFLIGVPFMSVLIFLPQRFQVVDGMSPLQAGLHTLPYILMVPMGTVVASAASIVLKSKHLHQQLFGAILQLIAVVCFATVDTSSSGNSKTVHPAQYAFQILIGLGNGLSYSANFNGMPYSLDGHRELVAPAMGSNAQFRYLGAAVGLGSLTAAFNTGVRAHLSGILTSVQITQILQSTSTIPTLSASIQAQTIEALTKAFVLQWQIMCGFVGLQIIAILSTW